MKKKIDGSASFSISRSRYVSLLKDSKSLIIISLVMAAVCVWISYPGIMYSDSYNRIYFAEEMIQKLHGASGVGNQIWLTPTPSYFMAVCLLLTGNIATFTFCHAFAYFFASFLLIRKIVGKYRWIEYLLYALSPIFFCVSVYYEAGIGSLVGIICIFLLLQSDIEPKNLFDGIIPLILVALFAFVAFGFRANAFTVIPVFVLMILLKKAKKAWKTWLTAALIGGFLMVSIVPKVLNINTMSSMAAGFVWEIVTVIRDMEEEKQAEYIDYLDEVGGPGSTAEAVEKSITNDQCKWNICPIIFETRINTTTLSAEGINQLVISKYLKLFLDAPVEWIKNKWYYVSGSLGIHTPLRLVEWNYNRNDQMDNFNYNDSDVRRWFVDVYEKQVEQFSIVLRPYLMFIFGLILLAIQRKVLSQNEDTKRLFTNEVYLYLIALFYYGAYLLNNQSFEFRYFYPSFYLLALSSMSIIIQLLEKGYLHLRGKRKNEIVNI